MSDSSPEIASPRRRLRRAAIALACVLVLLGVGLRLAAPELLRSLAEREGTAALGRPLRVEGVDLSVLGGRLDARGIEIGGSEAPGALPEAESVLRLASLSVTLDWLALVGREIHFREIAFESPRLALERGADGSLVPLVLAESAPPDPEASEAAVWPLLIDRLVFRDGEVTLGRIGAAGEDLAFAWESLGFDALHLRDGTVEIQDLSIEAPSLRIDRRVAAAPEAVETAPPSEEPTPPESTSDGNDLEGHAIASLSVRGAQLSLLEESGDPLVVTLDVSATDLSVARSATFPFSLSAAHDGATLAISGKLGLRPLQFAGGVEWKGLRLPRLAEVFAGDVVAVASGTTNGRLDLGLAPASQEGGGPGLRVRGILDLREASFATPDLDAAWESLEVEIAPTVVALERGVETIALSRVVLQAPRLDYTLRAAAEAPPAGSEDPPGAAPQITVGRFELAEGRLGFRDETLAPPFETAWRAVNVSVNDVAWPQGSARELSVAARGPSGEKLSISGDLRDGNGRVDATLRNLALAALDPYAEASTGVRIGAGRGTIDGLVVELEPGRARVDSAIVLRDLQVRESEAGWFERVFGLPLDVALALLRDLRGVITLPLGVDIERGEATVGTAGLLASALRQAVLGALTSPLKILGGAVDFAGDLAGPRVPMLAASPGQADPSEAAADKLPEIADLLTERPGLQLVLRGQAGRADDPVLQRRVLREHLDRGEPLPGGEALDAAERERVRHALASLDATIGESLDPSTEALLEGLAAGIVVPEATRAALATARAERVREELVTQYGRPPGQVVVAESSEGKPGVLLELRAQTPDAEAP